MTDTAALEKALQTTVERLVESRLETLRQELAQELQGEIAMALARLSKGEASASSAQPATSPELAALKECIAGILQPTGQSDVMGASLKGAAGFAGRCALFVRRGDAFAFWRAEGFGAESIGSLRSLSLPAGQPGIFKELCDTRQAISRPPSPEALPPMFERALGDRSESIFYLLPIAVQGRVIAALYADAGSGSAGSVEPAALEILARVCGLSLETAAGRAASPSGTGLEPATTGTVKLRVSPPGGVSTADSPTLAFAPGTLAGVPLAKEVPEEYPPPPATLAEGSATIAAAGAPAGSFAASIPPAPVAISALVPPPDPDSLPAADREAHRKAHRFARVAVQDLLSYHKNKIEQGRNNKNLYSLLKEDIEKTRANYQQRFGQTAARSFDYLHYELVVKLAGNDPAAMGAKYPGPSVEK